MSIKVMNWVWECSEATGGDLLVLLAIADHAGDDGADAFPTIETLAAKCRMSQRSIQRVVSRLTKLGELRVDRNGGGMARTPPCWRPNRYRVVMNEVVDNPADRGDRLSPPTRGRDDAADTPRGDPRDTTTGDTAVTQNRPNEPSRNHRPHTRAAEDSSAPVEGGGGEGLAEAFFAALGGKWRLSRGQRGRLGPQIYAAVATGWSPIGLASHVGVNVHGVRNPYAVLASRLADLPDPPAQQAPRPPWCGSCDERTRHREDDQGRLLRCPACHPLRGVAGKRAVLPAERDVETGGAPKRAPTRSGPFPGAEPARCGETAPPITHDRQGA